MDSTHKCPRTDLCNRKRREIKICSDAAILLQHTVFNYIRIRHILIADQIIRTHCLRDGIAADSNRLKNRRSRNFNRGRIEKPVCLRGDTAVHCIIDYSAGRLYDNGDRNRIGIRTRCNRELRHSACNLIITDHNPTEFIFVDGNRPELTAFSDFNIGAVIQQACFRRRIRAVQCIINCGIRHIAAERDILYAVICAGCKGCSRCRGAVLSGNQISEIHHAPAILRIKARIAEIHGVLRKTGAEHFGRHVLVI